MLRTVCSIDANGRRHYFRGSKEIKPTKRDKNSTRCRRKVLSEDPVTCHVSTDAHGYTHKEYRVGGVPVPVTTARTHRGFGSKCVRGQQTQRLLDTCASHQAQLTECNRRQATCNRSLADCKANLQAYQDELDRVRRENEEKNLQSQTLITTLRAFVERCRQEQGMIGNALDVEQAERRQDAARLQALGAIAIGEQEYQPRLQDLDVRINQDIQHRDNRIHELTTRQEELTAAIEAARTQILELQGQLENVHAQEDNKCNQRLAELRTEHTGIVNKLVADAEAKTQEIRAVVQELDEIRRHYQTCDRERKECTDKLEVIGRDITELTGHMNRLGVSIQHDLVSREDNSKDAEINRLQTQIVSLSQQHAAKESEKNAEILRLLVLNEQSNIAKARFEGELQRVQRKNEWLIKIKDQLKKEVDDCERKLIKLKIKEEEVKQAVEDGSYSLAEIKDLVKNDDQTDASQLPKEERDELADIIDYPELITQPPTPSLGNSPVTPSPKGSPVLEGSLMSAPVLEDISVRTPVRKTPVRQTPVRRTPVRTTPVRQTPVRKTPRRDDIIHDGKTPTRNISAGRTPIMMGPDISPAGNISAGRTPIMMGPDISPFPQLELNVEEPGLESEQESEQDVEQKLEEVSDDEVEETVPSPSYLSPVDEEFEDKHDMGEDEKPEPKSPIDVLLSGLNERSQADFEAQIDELSPEDQAAIEWFNQQMAENAGSNPEVVEEDVEDVEEVEENDGGDYPEEEEAPGDYSDDE